MVDGLKLPTGSITNIAITAGILLVGAVVVISAVRGISKANPFENLFGGDEKKEQGGQQSNQKAEIDRASAEQTRADAEVGRLESELALADAEGRKADAEFLRAQAELARADAEKARDYTDRLKNEQQFILESQGALETQSQNSPKQDAVETTQKEIIAGKSLTTDEDSNTGLSDSVTLVRTTGRNKGETITVSSDKVDLLLRRGFALQTDVNLTKSDAGSVSTIVETSNTDANEKAIQTISSSKVGKKNSVFSNASIFVNSITSDGGIDTKKIITGGGSSSKGTQAFIFSTKPKTLSDVLKQNPTFTASQARDFLNRSGTFATESDRRAFESKDFGSNTGSAPKRETLNPGGESVSADKTTRTSASQKRLEEIRAQKKRDAILRSRQRLNNERLEAIN